MIQRQLENQLQDLIGTLENGQKLPSLRQLAERFGVSVVSIQKSLSKLVAAGQLLSKPCSGYYKSMPILRKLEILLFDRNIAEGEFSFHRYFFSTVMTHLLCGQRQVRVHLCDSPVAPEMLKGWADPDNSIVLTYRIGRAQLPIADALQEYGIPHVHIIPNLPLDTSLGPAIRVDDEANIRMQLQFLRRLGCRRVAGLFPWLDGVYVRAWEDRMNAFCRLSVELGFEMSPEYLVRLDDPENDILKAVTKFRNSVNPPEAMLMSDRYAPIFYRAMRSCGMEPGRDMKIIGTDDMPWSDKLSPQLTCIRISPDSLKQLLDETISVYEMGHSVADRSLEQTIIERETT